MGSFIGAISRAVNPKFADLNNAGAVVNPGNQQNQNMPAQQQPQQQNAGNMQTQATGYNAQQNAQAIASGQPKQDVQSSPPGLGAATAIGPVLTAAGGAAAPRTAIHGANGAVTGYSSSGDKTPGGDQVQYYNGQPVNAGDRTSGAGRSPLTALLSAAGADPNSSLNRPNGGVTYQQNPATGETIAVGPDGKPMGAPPAFQGTGGTVDMSSATPINTYVRPRPTNFGAPGQHASDFIPMVGLDNGVVQQPPAASVSPPVPAASVSPPVNPNRPAAAGGPDKGQWNDPSIMPSAKQTYGRR